MACFASVISQTQPPDLPLKMWKKLPRHEGYISSGTVQLEKTGSCGSKAYVQRWLRSGVLV